MEEAYPNNTQPATFLLSVLGFNFQVRYYRQAIKISEECVDSQFYWRMCASAVKGQPAFLAH